MNDIREDLKAFLDGELSPPRAAEVQAALSGDPALQEELELMKALGFEIRKMKREPAVAGAEATMTKLRKKPRAWWLRPEPYFAVGFAVIICVITFPVYAQSKGSMDSLARSKVDAFSPEAHAGVNVSEAPAIIQNDGRRTGGMDVGGGGGATGATGSTGSTGDLSGKSRMESNLYGFNNRGDKGIEGGPAQPSTTITPRAPQLLIRTADLHRRVEDVAIAQRDMIRIATANGGFLAGNNMTGSEGQLPEANVTIRVPVKRFDAVCESIRAMGTLVSDNTNTDDVTTQVADTEARLKVMRAEEDSYVTMLRAARKVGELLEIKERLSSVRQEIESLDAQRKALRDQSSYSTINAVFTQKAKIGTPETPKDWSEDTWSNAVNGLTSALRWLGQVVITVFVYSPLWLPVVLIGVWMSRKAKK